jgi:NADPH2:quinone reductase
LIDSESEDIRLAIKDLGGADVVYDPVGGSQFTAALRACNPDARMLAIGFASGDVPQIPANHLLVKNITVIGFYWGGYLSHRPSVVTDSLKQLVQWHAQGAIKPHISHVLPLTNAAEGLELLRSRKSTGKIVICP